MEKKIITLSIVLIVLVVAGIWYLNQPPKIVPSSLENNVPVAEAPTANVIVATFDCDNGITVKASFDNNEPQKVSLEISDGRKVELPRAMSGSGARYANKEESFVFWNKGDTAFIEENGTTTITGCLVK